MVTHPHNDSYGLGDLKALIGEYENGDSLEVLIAHDTDKPECTIQGIEYPQQGYPAAQERVDSTKAKLRTAAARTLAQAARTIRIAEWQRTYLH